MGRNRRLKQARRRDRAAGIEEVEVRLARLRAWTLADDGTIRDRAAMAPPGLHLHVAIENDSGLQSYWRNLPIGVNWTTMKWEDADDGVRRLGLPEKPWAAFKADVESLAREIEIVPCICINRVRHPAYGDVGGWTPTIHRRGVHEVYATPAARACVSPQFRRALIAETYLSHRHAWKTMVDPRDRRHGVLRWELPGDVVPTPLVVCYRAEPYFLYVETMEEFQRGTGGATIKDLAATTPQLIPDLPVRLADGPPPWAVPGGNLDLSDDNRWESPADPPPVGGSRVAADAGGHHRGRARDEMHHDESQCGPETVQRDRSCNSHQDARARALANHAHLNLLHVRCHVERFGPHELGIFTNVGHTRPDGTDPFHDLLRRSDAPWRWLGYDVDDSGYSAATIVQVSPDTSEGQALAYVANCIREANLPGLRFGK
jgi:hypothetical protein